MPVPTLETCIHGNKRYPRKHVDRCAECKATDPGPLAIIVDAESARDQERRHLSKAAHYDRLAQRERDEATKFRGWAERAEAGHPVILSDRKIR